jgi:hypothetical protein
MLMLLGPFCIDVLRATSGPDAMFRGSVGADFNGGGALVVAGGGAVGGSDMAMPGSPDGFSDRTDICEGLRESMVGMGVGFGAGRVYTAGASAVLFARKKKHNSQIRGICTNGAACDGKRTFRKQAILSCLGVLA